MNIDISIFKTDYQTLELDLGSCITSMGIKHSGLQFTCCVKVAHHPVGTNHFKTDIWTTLMLT